MIFLMLVISLQLSAQPPEAILEAKGIQLPTVGDPVASFVHVVRSGKLLFLSGKGPTDSLGNSIKGKLGADLDVQQGYYAARSIALLHIAVLKKELGNLKKVKRVVKVLGLVNSHDSFSDQPKVMNGYSDLMVEVFGNKGRHARSAIGVNTLPSNIAVEVEVIVEARR